MISILDYGMGNIGSLINMFMQVDEDVAVISKKDDVLKANKLVLPGVGSFKAAMQRINEIPGLRDALDVKALKHQIPILGVCLGMQLLTESSQEGPADGLGWISGTTKKFEKIGDIKIPHMGWNAVRVVQENKLTESVNDESKYYFVHSYYVEVRDEQSSLLKTEHGVVFDSAIVRENIFGVQFHPEKSHKHGMKLLGSFAKL
jgi:imidazole glycerol-phosphate synthase subunit HisH